MHFLTDDYRLTSINDRADILTGLNAMLFKTAGKFKTGVKITSALLTQSEKIHDGAKQWQSLSQQGLKEALYGFRETFRRHKKGFEESLPDALGAIMEVAYRTLGYRPYVVQTAGALALYKEYIIEMQTGEGKTLTAALIAAVRGWSGYPCHVITANDYLAERDAQNLSPFYNFCGVTAGNVASTMKPEERKRGYACDITYSTAKEVTADFLRDRLALGKLQKFERRQIEALSGNMEIGNGVVTRGMHAAIIDEADSLLIDEAVTPLIISRQQTNEDFVKACQSACSIAARLVPGKDYTADFHYKDIELSQQLDFSKLVQQQSIPRQYSSHGFQRELLRQALIAKEFYHRDKQYVIQDDKIVIVDEFTGRTMAQRSWSEGLHQMVEAKEGVPLTPPNETLARLSFQRYFRFYSSLAGMTGTASESADELWHIYGLPTIRIPPNKPSQRTILPSRFFVAQREKWEAIVSDIEAVHKTGRPVLIGTRSVEKSEELAGQLAEKGIACRVINAIRHKEEAAIVAEAGKPGAITVATNMAGRGTDILLDRTCEEKGGLHVIAAECNESSRIDRQLFGRCARQGDRGTAQAFISMDDEMLRRYCAPTLLRTATELLKAKPGFAFRMANRVVKWAQNKAQRRAYSSRKSVQKMDTWLKDSLSFEQGDF